MPGTRLSPASIRTIAWSVWTGAVVVLGVYAVSSALYLNSRCSGEDGGNLCGVHVMIIGLLLGLPAFLALAFVFDFVLTGQIWHVAILVAATILGPLVTGPLVNTVGAAATLVVPLTWLLLIPGVPIALLWTRNRVSTSAPASPPGDPSVFAVDSDAARTAQFNNEVVIAATATVSLILAAFAVALTWLF